MMSDVDSVSTLPRRLKIKFGMHVGNVNRRKEKSNPEKSENVLRGFPETRSRTFLVGLFPMETGVVISVSSGLDSGLFLRSDESTVTTKFKMVNIPVISTPM